MLASGVLGVAALVVAAAPAQANLLANPGFEDPVTSDGAPFVGSWEAFSGVPAPGAVSANSSVSPRNGAQHLLMSIDNVDNTFAGAFQDVPNLIAGTQGIFSGWHKTTAEPLGLVAEVRIEWRNAGSNTEISRTPNMLPTLTTAYSEFTLAAEVPAGADTARVVYAIQTFTGTSNSGTVHLDDVSFVPEPGSALAAGLGGLVLAARRRRRD
jgi:hypothetical protein